MNKCLCGEKCQYHHSIENKLKKMFAELDTLPLDKRNEAKEQILEEVRKQSMNLPKTFTTSIQNVGMLRQWLNERSDDRLLTNDDLIHWLTWK